MLRSIACPNGWTALILAIPFALLAFCAGPRADAQSPIIRIEERWELSVTQPDPQKSAPQVLMSFQPFGLETPYHFEVDLNNYSHPKRKPGGVQIRAMFGGECLSEAHILENMRLNAPSETVTWTQIAQKQPQGWAFAIGGGSSNTWGNFGGTNTIVMMPDIPLQIKYSPNHSLKESRIILGRERVERLTLVSVRYVDSSGQISDIPVGKSVE